MNKKIFVSQTELAGYLNLSTRRVRDLEEKGAFTREKSGKYQLKKSIHGFVAYLRDQIKGTGNVTLTDARTRRELAKAELAELELRQKRNELIPKNQSIVWLCTLVNNARIGFQSLPRRLAPILKLKEDERAIEEELRTEIHKILRELAENKQ